MKKEHEEFLVNKFPLLYADYHKPSTCMGRGFEVGDGWFTLIHGVSLAIQSHIDWANQQVAEAVAWNAMVSAGDHPTWWGDRIDEPAKRKVPKKIKQFKVSQVKEKFGTLRFYVLGCNEVIENYIRCAEYMSAVTCETCGAPGEMTQASWCRTTCPACEEKRNQEKE